MQLICRRLGIESSFFVEYNRFETEAMKACTQLASTSRPALKALKIKSKIFNRQ